MSRPSFPMHKPHSIPDNEVNVSQVHLITDFIEAERVANWYSGTRRKESFIGTLYMLKVVGDNIHQLKFQGLFTPDLTEMRRRLALSSLCYTINRMEDRDARQKCMTDRASVCVKVIECRVYDQL